MVWDPIVLFFLHATPVYPDVFYVNFIIKTSGNYEKVYDIENSWITHIINIM